jgi:hypothetical protein
LEQWAADLARQFDVDDGQTRLSRSQKARALREQAARYRAMQTVKAFPVRRSDVGI